MTDPGAAVAWKIIATASFGSVIGNPVYFEARLTVVAGVAGSFARQEPGGLNCRIAQRWEAFAVTPRVLVAGGAEAQTPNRFLQKRSLKADAFNVPASR